MKRQKCSEPAKPDRIRSYFRCERTPLFFVAVCGIIYNIGMTAGPWFEGKLAQTLCDVFSGEKTSADMINVAVLYVLVILLVQLLRYFKRYYVRLFANNVSRNMKRVLYRNLVHKTTAETESENVGTLMTKAVSDVDDCAEGMRKFTTEIFDTGVVMISYLAMMFIYDWRLSLISCVFPPFAYVAAEFLKKKVTESAAEYKVSTGKLYGETYDRISGALTYRVLGEENNRNKSYEKRLSDYEKKAIRSGVLETAVLPLYHIVSMISVIFIILYGAKNIRGDGFTAWDIAAFTTYLSCFAKLALKSSKAAKLFNAVQKARVSWDRIKPLMKTISPKEKVTSKSPCDITVSGLSFSYPGGKEILHDISFLVKPGQIVGITGAVACGKSTLGKVFLNEAPYSGSIYFGDRELRSLAPGELYSYVSYMGHGAELLSDTVKENIQLGEDGDITEYIKAMCIDKELDEMPERAETKIGNGGIRLSGGQQSRIVLARILYHKKPLIILDDPFSALDKQTETEIFENLRKLCADCAVLLISHRLYLFPHLDRVLWMENGTLTESTHSELLNSSPEYRELFESQNGGDCCETQKLS